MGYIEANGTYVLTNAKSPSVALDLSGGDSRSIIGFQPHRGANQQWFLEPAGPNLYYFRNVGLGKYLDIDGDPNHLRDAIRVVANDQRRIAWEVRPDDQDGSVHRIFVAGTVFNADLTNYGSTEPGTPIEIWGKWEARNQCWHFERVN